MIEEVGEIRSINHNNLQGCDFIRRITEKLFLR